MMRFSTSPSSLTSTASALPGPRLTNSTCFSVLLCLSTSTTPAQPESPDSMAPASDEEFLDRAMATIAGDAGLDLAPLLLAHLADLQQAVDEEA